MHTSLLFVVWIPLQNVSEAGAPYSVNSDMPLSFCHGFTGSLSGFSTKLPEKVDKKLKRVQNDPGMSID
jgi:hypothetical protein